MSEQHPIPVPPNVQNLIGLPPFGELTVLSYAGKRKDRHVWLCRCSCGGEAVVGGADMRSGNTRSCGCFRRDSVRDQFFKHGKSDSSEHRIWSGMIQRCTNPAVAAFDNYGAAGVTVCERWRNSFANFYADMGPRPSRSHSLDRFPNQKGNYEPSNVRWATAAEQSRNRKCNVLVTYQGETLCQKDWAKRFGIKLTTLRRRVASGWSFDRAVATPVAPWNR